MLKCWNIENVSQKMPDPQMILEIQMSVPGLTLFVLVPCEILPLSHIVSSSPFRYLSCLCMSPASRDLFQEAEKHPLDCFDANTLELIGTDFKRWWWHLGESGEYNLSCFADVSVDMPDLLDISHLRARGLQPGEEELPDISPPILIPDDSKGTIFC